MRNGAARNYAIVTSAYWGFTLTDGALRMLAPVDKFLQRHGVGAKSLWKVGSPGAAISKFTTDGKFDLIVMGSHGHGAVANLVMGSVATQVLTHCKVPVLMVR